MWKGQEKKTGYLPNIGDKTKDLRLNQFSSGKLIGCFFNGFACQSWRLPTCLLCFFFPKVIPKNLGSFHIQKQERVTNMTLFFFLGGEWNGNHRTIIQYMSQFFLFFYGGSACVCRIWYSQRRSPDKIWATLLDRLVPVWLPNAFQLQGINWAIFVGVSKIGTPLVSRCWFFGVQGLDFCHDFCFEDPELGSTSWYGKSPRAFFFANPADHILHRSTGSWTIFLKHQLINFKLSIILDPPGYA